MINVSTRFACQKFNYARFEFAPPAVHATPHIPVLNAVLKVREDRTCWPNMLNSSHSFCYASVMPNERTVPDATDAITARAHTRPDERPSASVNRMQTLILHILHPTSPRPCVKVPTDATLLVVLIHTHAWIKVEKIKYPRWPKRARVEDEKDAGRHTSGKEYMRRKWRHRSGEISFRLSAWLRGIEKMNQPGNPTYTTL